jgi:hypothetical protein
MAYPSFLRDVEQRLASQFLLIEIGVSILMAFALRSAGKAILVAILMHAALNASSQFLDPFLGQTATRSRPSAEMTLAFAYLFVAGSIVLFTRGSLLSTAGMKDVSR